MIRIISGIHKGRRIQAPKQLPVRPTTDRSKEALFNILNNQIDWQECSVLDLFSGTGNISYEFASRGSQQIVAVDSHPACTSFIQKTARELNLPIQVVKLEVTSFLERNQIPFDVIFCDPPYTFTAQQLSNLVELCLTPKHLSEEGLLVIEHIKHISLEELPGFIESRRYGQSVFSFFQLEGTK